MVPRRTDPPSLLPGAQLHFFPALVDVQQLNAVLVAKGVPSERYNPK